MVLDQTEEPSERPPVVEGQSRAADMAFVRAEVLAYESVAPPLSEHHLAHLLDKTTTSLPVDDY